MGRMDSLERSSVQLDKLHRAFPGPAAGARREGEALGSRMGSLDRTSMGLGRALLRGAANPGTPDHGAGARGEGGGLGNLDAVSSSTFVSPVRNAEDSAIAGTAAPPAAGPVTPAEAPASPGPGPSQLGAEADAKAGSPRSVRWGSPVKALAGLVAARARLPPAPSMFEDLDGLA